MPFSTAPPVYLALSRIIIFSEPILLTWELISQAMLLVALGVGMMIGGFYLTKRVLRRGPIARADLPLDARKFNLCVAASALMGIVVLTLQSEGTASAGTDFGAIFRLLANQLNIAIVLLAFRAFSRGVGLQLRTFLVMCALVATAVAFGLATGFLESALIPLALVIVVWWQSRQRLPVALLLGGFLLFVIFNSAKHDYRSQVWGADSPAGLSDRITPWFDISGAAVTTIANGDILIDTNTTIQNSMQRLDLLHRFAYVLALTPTPLPYLDGETYGYFAVTWIPRFLWPGKPDASVALNRVDSYYRLRDESNSSTIAIGQLAEAYANFGVNGIVLVLALQGVLFGLLDHVLNGPDSEGGRAIYLTLMVSFLNGIGSLSVILFGNLLQGIILSAILLRPFATGFSQRLLPDERAGDRRTSSGNTPPHKNIQAERKFDART